MIGFAADRIGILWRHQISITYRGPRREQLWPKGDQFKPWPTTFHFDADLSTFNAPQTVPFARPLPAPERATLMDDAYNAVTITRKWPFMNRAAIC